MEAFRFKKKTLPFSTNFSAEIGIASMSALWVRSLFVALGGHGKRTSLSIFVFHRVLEQRDLLFPSEPVAAEFDEIIHWITNWFNVLPLDEAVHCLVEGSLPSRAACVTFDDGYADNFTVALPVLKRYDAHATFFVTTGSLDGGRMWNDTLIEAVRRTPEERIDLASIGLEELSVGTIDEKRAALERLIPALKYRNAADRADAVATVAEICRAPTLPDDLMMTNHQVRLLHAAGMGVGAHTVTHPILASCAPDTARREIAASREHLEALIGERITLFAYPNGKQGSDYTAEHVRMVRELGFKGAVSTNIGVSRHGDDPFQLRRFTPWDRTQGRFALRLAQNLLADCQRRLKSNPF